MQLEMRFSNEELVKIIDAATIYMCACPAQVGKAILDLRALFRYQAGCLNDGDANAEVHQLIAATVAENHRQMESLIDQILTLEGWDRTTFEMPEGLRQLRDRSLA